MRNESTIQNSSATMEVDESSKTLPLMGGVIGLEPTDPESDITSSKSRLNMLSHGTLLLLLVATIAAGSLYLMRVTHVKIERVDVNRDAAAKIEQALAKLANPQAMDSADPLRSVNMQTLFHNTEAVVSMFTNDQTQHQVPLEFLKKNPFLEIMERPIVVTGLADPIAPKSNTSIEDQARKIDTELRSLRLEMVVEGSNPIAMINGRAVRVGDQLGRFTVKAINGRSVELQLPEGTIYSLLMQDREDDLAKTPTRRR